MKYQITEQENYILIEILESQTSESHYSHFKKLFKAIQLKKINLVSEIMKEVGDHQHEKQSQELLRVQLLKRFWLQTKFKSPPMLTGFTILHALNLVISLPFLRLNNPQPVARTPKQPKKWNNAFWQQKRMEIQWVVQFFVG